MSDPRGPLDEWEAPSYRRRGLSDDDVYLPGEISDLAEHASVELPNNVYGEIMEAAEMLHDLGIKDASELGNLLGAHHDGCKWTFSTALPDLDSISDEDYADLVYEGRLLCGAEPTEGTMDPGYCGGPPRDVHDEQVLDPNSWVHSAFERWFERAFEHFHGKNAWKHHAVKKMDVPLKKVSDRRLAVDATKRKNNVSE